MGNEEQESSDESVTAEVGAATGAASASEGQENATTGAVQAEPVPPATIDQTSDAIRADVPPAYAPPPSVSFDKQPDHFIPSDRIAPPEAFYSLLDLGKVSKENLTNSASVDITEPRRVHENGMVHLFGWIGGILHEAWLALEHFEQRVKDEVVEGVQTFRSHTEDELNALCHVHLAVNGTPVPVAEGVTPLAPPAADEIAAKVG